MDALSGIVREALIVATILCFPVLVVATAVAPALSRTFALPASQALGRSRRPGPL